MVTTTLFTIAVCSSAPSMRASLDRTLPAATEELLAPLEDPPIDFRGNEVRPAIANYKIDPTGALYEEHSPETEVPKLAPPRS